MKTSVSNDLDILFMSTFENTIKEILSNRVYDSQKVLAKPHVKQLLYERYLFKYPKAFAEEMGLTDDRFEKIMYCIEMIQDKQVQRINVKDKDGNYIGEEYYAETFRMLARRTAKRIATGFLNILNPYMQGVKETEWLDLFRYASEEEKLEFLNTFAKAVEDAIANLIFLPSSPFMFNAGRAIMDQPEVKLLYKDYSEMTFDDWQVLSEVNDPAYGSCYSMGSIEDDTNDIYDMLRKQAHVFRHAGGFGVNFSKLRSKYAFVSTIKGNSSGAVSFMKPFNDTTELIALSSSLKRGM
jgi:ribonucleotide reductase alpha subunit